MAQTKRRRRRKHRGTQAGSIDRRGHTSRPRSRAEARSRARSQSAQRRDQPPSWRSAFNRGLVAAGIFFVLLVLIFRRPLAPSLVLSVFMLAIYVPLGYYTDRFFYRRRQRQRQREHEERKARA